MVLEPIYNGNDWTAIETLGMHIVGKKGSPWGIMFQHMGIPRDYTGYVPWARYLLLNNAKELQRVQIYEGVYLSIF